MLISLNWIRDYVDLPAELDPRDLAERFTTTVAEVDGVRQVRVGARGLIAARVVSAEHLPRTRNLRLVVLDVGGGQSIETVSAAPAMHVGHNVVYAPEGSALVGLGEIGAPQVAGRRSAGMILPAESLGMAMAAQEAVFLDESLEPGAELHSDLFDDWVIEIDNKALTNRPDLWGHYGIAREIAALVGRELRELPTTPEAELAAGRLRGVEINIEDGEACPRYTGIVLGGVPTQPAPLWMQLRLGHVGMRPISGLVDLTNYVMADLGQPMHAFDADLVGQIEVGWAQEGEVFRTLDGVERSLTRQALMIKCRGQSIALAGIMGGLESEVSERTSRLLLESANFHPAVIRRTSQRLGLRTDASARFEKSLDPANTVLGVRRFIALARSMYPGLTLESRLSDAYPRPLEPANVSVNPWHVERAMGRPMEEEEVGRLLEPLGFRIEPADGEWRVQVPSFRSTGDVAIEADVIEEIARRAGYDSIEPQMPRVSIRRFVPNRLHDLEQQALDYFATSHDFHEIQGYLWYDRNWLRQIEAEPGRCIRLRNPPGEGLDLLRRSLMPGLLAAVNRNRFHFPELSIMELGSVFEHAEPEDMEFRHLALVRAKRAKRAEQDLYDRLKGAIEGFAWKATSRQVRFVAAEPDASHPWEHDQRTAMVEIDGMHIGRISQVDLPLRQAMDEHLVPWAIVWAELSVSALAGVQPKVEPMGTIPPHPRVELDFSFLVPAGDRYSEVVNYLLDFEHPLLRQLRYVGSYEGEAVGAGRRSLTFRAVVGEESRTLIEDDTISFARQFEEHLARRGYQIRK